MHNEVCNGLYVTVNCRLRKETPVETARSIPTCCSVFACMHVVLFQTWKRGVYVVHYSIYAASECHRDRTSFGMLSGVRTKRDPILNYGKW